MLLMHRNSYFQYDAIENSDNCYHIARKWSEIDAWVCLGEQVLWKELLK